MIFANLKRILTKKTCCKRIFTNFNSDGEDEQVIEDSLIADRNSFDNFDDEEKV